MEDKKRKLQFKLWLGAVFGSIIAFLIVKLLWKDANPMLLLVFLILGFLINLIITLYNQSNWENGY
ncbi:hypothetical protein J416_15637 [Gracilibacillus halophilus YIM-C55.5]|uniref:Uncharacterized protein n=1 Tax=Gracilibacillus halophilus YIM-C55.5 TaxID=1308866 RepID=N4WQP4_9BACI|nr:hypothetical protein [Gracilibacillus halophilus]ENH95526.1 hypothetical protein J416_15637 [Gracilibacillus halophilus YIM-C55.5]